jgi:hypothetical protein
LLQPDIYQLQSVLVFAILIASGFDDRENVVGIGAMITVYDFLCTLLNLDVKQLPGLLATICYAAALYIFAAKMRHIDEGHATSVETEDEQVTGKG